MRTLPRPDAVTVALSFVALAAAAAALAYDDHAEVQPATAFTWQGVAGDARPAVSLGQRMIVVLRAPSLAQRVARAPHATNAQERAWTGAAFAAQHAVLATLAAHGLTVEPDFSFARVLDGFSAPLDPRAVARLDADPRVLGIYPVRAAFPATVAGGETAGAADVPVLPGYDGRGVTIALLDTGVDDSQPYLHGRVLPGLDVVGGGATAQADPQDPSRREQHGTELAGLLVGTGGPVGSRGVAPGARVLPIRVAGWQLDAAAQDAVYARTDQLIAGLERAVDPNGDGDAHDGARIALVGVAEPFAAFADSPEARAVDGATALNTLVVTPAGNDGDAGPVFGSISGPGGAAGALTVGATDGRTAAPAARVVLRAGLRVAYDGSLPLLGSAAPRHPVELAFGVPFRGGGAGVGDYFDHAGLDAVAGRAALVPTGADPAAAAAAAAAAGASAVLLYAPAIPAGPLALGSGVNVPVLGLPAAAAAELLAALRRGADAGVSLAPAVSERRRAESVAGFSSRGLSFDGSVKPDLLAPGVGLTTSNAGVDSAGEPAFATVSGTSAAAATVAGAAALLAQARPRLDAAELASLLTGGSANGELDLRRSAATELATSSRALAFGHDPARGRLVLRNLSPQELRVEGVASGEVTIRAGHTIAVTVAGTPHRRTGTLRLVPNRGPAVRVPWVLAAGPGPPLLAKASIRPASFAPSDRSPALLVLQVGRVETAGRLQIRPARVLVLRLADARGRDLGLLARERDLLPGSYRFALTGRGPTGSRLAPGRYTLRVTAWPTVAGRPSRAVVRFRIH